VANQSFRKQGFWANYTVSNENEFWVVRNPETILTSYEEVEKLGQGALHIKPRTAFQSIWKDVSGSDKVNWKEEV